MADAGSAAARLEAALDRIAQAAARPPAVEFVTRASEGEAETEDGLRRAEEAERRFAEAEAERSRLAAELAERDALANQVANRLDALIDELRGVLARKS